MEQLSRIDPDAEVQDRFGHEITDLRVVCDTRRRLQLIDELENQDDPTEGEDDV